MQRPVKGGSSDCRPRRRFAAIVEKARQCRAFSIVYVGERQLTGSVPTSHFHYDSAGASNQDATYHGTAKGKDHSSHATFVAARNGRGWQSDPQSDQAAADSPADEWCENEHSQAFRFTAKWQHRSKCKRAQFPRRGLALQQQRETL